MAGDAPPSDAAARAEALLAAAEAAAQAAAAARAQAIAALEGAPAPAGWAGAPGPGPLPRRGRRARSPPPGRRPRAPGRDPTAPARLLALAEELAARTHDARHQLDALADAVERALAGAAAARRPQAAGARPGPTPEDLRAATARLVAVEMALAGASRTEVADVLARAFGTADERLLDEILGGAAPRPAASAAAAVRPRR